MFKAIQETMVNINWKTFLKNKQSMETLQKNYRRHTRLLRREGSQIFCARCDFVNLFWIQLNCALLIHCASIPYWLWHHWYLLCIALLSKCHQVLLFHFCHHHHSLSVSYLQLKKSTRSFALGSRVSQLPTNWAIPSTSGPSLYTTWNITSILEGQS